MGKSFTRRSRKERLSVQTEGDPGGGSTSHPFGSLATPSELGAHDFASSPRGEFAFVEDEEAKTWIFTTRTSEPGGSFSLPRASVSPLRHNSRLRLRGSQMVATNFRENRQIGIIGEGEDLTTNEPEA